MVIYIFKASPIPVEKLPSLVLRTSSGLSTIWKYRSNLNRELTFFRHFWSQSWMVTNYSWLWCWMEQTELNQKELKIIQSSLALIEMLKLCIFSGAADYFFKKLFLHSLGIFQFKYLAITLDLCKLYLSYYILGPNTVPFPLSAEAIFYSKQKYKSETSFQISDWKKTICSNY